MDLAGTAAVRHPLTRIFAIFVLLICCAAGMGQPLPLDPEIARAIDGKPYSAAIVYAIVGGFIARVIARSAPRGLAPGEPVAR